MKIATLSSKNQITLPVEMVRALKLKSGQRVVIQKQITDAEQNLIITPIPKNVTRYYMGCGKKTFKALGGGEKFLKTLRKEWE